MSATSLADPSWPEVPLRDVCESIVDCVNKTAPLAETVTPYKMLRTTNVRDGFVDTINCRNVDEDTFLKWTRRQVPRSGDVILTREAPLGEVGLLRDADLVFLGQRLMSYRADRTKLDERFLLYSLMGPYLQGQIRAAGSGSTVEHMRVPDAESLMIRLPALSTQQRIGSILGAYDDLFDVNQRRIAILEEMARRLFDEWFVRFRYPGHEAVPLVETELGSVPEGWRAGVFADCVTVNPETLSPKKAPLRINYIDISSVSVGRVDAITPVDFADAPGRARRVVRDGDVIWSTVRPNRRSHALLLGLERDTIASTGFAVLRARNEEWAWAYESSRTDAFVGFLIGRARGAAYPAVVGSDFEEVPTLIPPQELRVDFQRQVGPMYESKAVLEAQNARLRAARDLLLSKLISGEIDVGRAEEALAEAAE